VSVPQVFVTPRDESFPNVLAETSFIAATGSKTGAACAPVKGLASSAPKADALPQDYVVIKSFPTNIMVGQRNAFTLTYNKLEGSETSLVSIAVMRSSDNTLIASAAVPAKAGPHTVKQFVDIPADTPSQDVYIVATLTPVGKDYSGRLSEDRRYNVNLEWVRAQRNLRA
jgi:hypothetical protein